MGEVLRRAFVIFGPVVLTWSVRQLVEWWQSQGGDDVTTRQGALDCGCRADAKHYEVMRRALNADPDDGCYYWEFPYSEQ